MELRVERHISESVIHEIERRLDAVEQRHGVRIVLAVESGSRAWGFASKDSDYDVRFIYVNPPEWYLAVDLEEKRDVIETPIGGVWDVNGWDLRKSLRLFRKSNPPLLEWLQSPIIYREEAATAKTLRNLLPNLYSPTACGYHYLHMAEKNYRGYLRGSEVWTKKYFYVLRPLLGCRWLERDLGAVPMEFEELVAGTDLPEALREAIANLLAKKRDGNELGLGPKIPAMNAFIESELNRLREAGIAREKPHRDVTELNNVFQSTLKEVWGR